MDLKNKEIRINSTQPIDSRHTDRKFSYPNPFEQNLFVKPHWSAWVGIPLVLVTILISWTLYIWIFVIIKKVRSMRHICYFYIASLNVTMMLHSLTNFPLSFIMELAGELPYTNTICAISVAMETITCHSILLHLMGSSLDTYFRLAKPNWFSLTHHRPATMRLKIAAPWIVSILQTLAQIILGDPFPPSQLEDERLCTSPDINFLILRTFVAFALPLLTSIVILFMAAHRLQQMQRLQIRKFESNMNYECHLMKYIRKCNCLRMSRCRSPKEKIVIMPLAYENIFPEPVDALPNPTSPPIPNSQTDEQSSTDLASPIHLKTNQQSVSATTRADLSLDRIHDQSKPITNTQHGSNSSDTGVSSQTTDETPDEIQRRNQTVLDASNVINLSPWNILCSSVSTTQTGTPLSSSTQTSSDSQVYLKILNHYCPQHGQVFIPVRPDTLYKPVLAVLEEKEYQYNPLASLTDTDSLQISELLSSNQTNPNTQQLITKLSAGYMKENFAAFQQQQREEDVPTSAASSNHLDHPVQWPNLSKRFSEQRAVKLNMITCAITIAMWAPFIAASLSHLLLSNSKYFHLLSIRTLIQFKWLTYFSCIAYPLGFICMDRELFRQFKWSCQRNCKSKPNEELPCLPTTISSSAV